MIGSTISHYKILEKIGEGGMGAVYKAEDINLKRTVALKFLPLKALGNERERARFIQEAQAEAALDHPNICTVYEIEEADGRIFIAMAFVPGKSLKEMIESGPPALAETLDIVIQIGEGLQDAHEKGIVHRDIKPANIMLNEKGQAKILDFGLAKLTDTISSATDGAAIGTLAYMSPEQVSGDKVDHRTDIWSLGIILYELLTGIQPFRRDKDYDAAVLYSIMHEYPTPPSQLNSEIPLELDLVVQYAIQKDPDKRHDTITEMLDDLNQLKNMLVAADSAPSHSSRIRRKRHISRKRTVALAAFVILAALISIPAFRDDHQPISIAVMDFTNQTDLPYFSNLLAKLLITDLEQSPHIQILSKHRMKELSERHGIDGSTLQNGFTVCRDAHVRYLVSPRIRQIGETFALDVDVYDVKTERVLFKKHAGPHPQDAVVALIDEISRAIKEELESGERWTDRQDRKLSEITTTSVEAFMFYDIGQSLYKGQDPLKAIPHVERAVAIDSTFTEAYYFLAILYDYIGDRDGALKCARKAATLTQRGSAQEIIKSSIFEHWVLGEWDEAIEYMTRYLELEPHDINMREKLGYVQSRFKNNLGEAITAFEDIIARDPNNLSGRLATVYNYLGKAYLHSGQFDKAMDAYTQYESLCPDKPDPLNSQANALCFAGRYEEAIATHLEVIQKYPKYYVGYKDLGLSYQAVGKCKKAENAFRRYLNAAPRESKPLGHILIGRIHLMNENAAKALQEADAAVGLDSLSLEALCLKGCIALELLHDSDMANKELLKMENQLANTDMLEDIHHYHYLQGMILLAANRIEEGLDVLRTEIETAPRDFSVFLRKELLRGYIQAGRTDEAIRETSELLRLNPNDGELLYLAGLSCRAAGKMREARRHFTQAMQTWRDADPGFPPLVRLISQLERV
jgi:serine/threonine protein kinase/tetratricopeptide (TPR) repeat protein